MAVLKEKVESHLDTAAGAYLRVCEGNVNQNMHEWIYFLVQGSGVEGIAIYPLSEFSQIV